MTCACITDEVIFEEGSIKCKICKEIVGKIHGD